MSVKLYQKSRWLMVSVMLCLTCMVYPVIAEDEFKQGVHYQLVTPAQPTTSSSGKVEVIEMLWYGCPMCYVLQPELEGWRRKQNHIHYQRMPAVTLEDMKFDARVFYAAELLGVLDKVHMRIFTAMQRHKRRLDTEEALVQFFTDYGIRPADFRRTFNGHAVASKVKQAIETGKHYGIQGAPTMIINGKYRLDPSMVYTIEEFINVLDFLVRKEQALIQP